MSPACLETIIKLHRATDDNLVELRTQVKRGTISTIPTTIRSADG